MSADRIFRDHDNGLLIDDLKPAMRRKIERLAREMNFDVNDVVLAVTLQFLNMPLSEQLRIYREYHGFFGVAYANDEEIVRAIGALEERFKEEIRKGRPR